MAPDIHDDAFSHFSKSKWIVVAARKLPPGGGGGWEDASISSAAKSSAPLPDDLTTECETIAPEGPIEKATPTDPAAPPPLGAGGIKFVAVDLGRDTRRIGRIRHMVRLGGAAAHPGAARGGAELRMRGLPWRMRLLALQVIARGGATQFPVLRRAFVALALLAPAHELFMEVLGFERQWNRVRRHDFRSGRREVLEHLRRRDLRLRRGFGGIVLGHGIGGCRQRSRSAMIGAASGVGVTLVSVTTSPSGIGSTETSFTGVICSKNTKDSHANTAT